jgi:hypothetical protein
VGLPENPDRVALDVAAVHVPGLQPRPARPADATMMGFGRELGPSWRKKQKIVPKRPRAYSLAINRAPNRRPLW